MGTTSAMNELRSLLEDYGYLASELAAPGEAQDCGPVTIEHLPDDAPDYCAEMAMDKPDVEADKEYQLTLRALGTLVAAGRPGGPNRQAAERGICLIKQLREQLEAYKTLLANAEDNLNKLDEARKKQSRFDRAVTRSSRLQLIEVVKEWRESGASVDQLIFRLQTKHIEVEDDP